MQCMSFHSYLAIPLLPTYRHYRPSRSAMALHYLWRSAMALLTTIALYDLMQLRPSLEGSFHVYIALGFPVSALYFTSLYDSSVQSSRVHDHCSYLSSFTQINTELLPLLPAPSIPSVDLRLTAPTIPLVFTRTRDYRRRMASGKYHQVVLQHISACNAIGLTNLIIFSSKTFHQ